MTSKSDKTAVLQILENKLEHSVNIGDKIVISADQYLVNEMLGAAILPKLKNLGLKRINPALRKETFEIFLDHGGIGTTQSYVEMHQAIREFCTKNNLAIHKPGTGISHIVLPELGAVIPGEIILGTDSHTTTAGALNTYAQAIGASDLIEIFVRTTTWIDVPSSIYYDLSGVYKSEFITGKDVILSILEQHGVTFGLDKAIEYNSTSNLSIADRLAISNMSAELGAKVSIFNYDITLEQYLKQLPLRRSQKPIYFNSTTDYEDKFELDISTIEPKVAKPHLPSNVVPVSDLDDVELDQIYIGSCTGARIEDIRLVAKKLKGKQVKIPTLISCGSHSIMRLASEEGLLDIFLKSGCDLIYPACNACFGGNVGLIGKGMKVLSTTNRNFKGRMGGDETSEVYLASPPTAAASALTGNITSPI